MHEPIFSVSAWCFMKCWPDTCRLTGETPMETIAAIINQEPKPFGPNTVPPEIAKIIKRTLRKDKNERYQTIKDLLIDLKEVKQELEFQNKLEKTVSPNNAERQTQMLHSDHA